MDMRKRITDQTHLARLYAIDGAYHSAARILRLLAEEVQQHADRFNDELKQAMAAKCDPINLAGSGPVPIEPREG